MSGVVEFRARIVNRRTGAEVELYSPALSLERRTRNKARAVRRSQTRRRRVHGRRRR